VINGNDPIETYLRLQEEMHYIRTKRKPVLLEARVSRLYGHSSASGANIIKEEDCITTFAERLQSAGFIDASGVKEIFARYENEAREAQETVRQEPTPDPASIWEKIWVGDENADWRKF
jgi:2-oxoisovalerate dehydrogenase E1 component alpha subunit